jgi:hypothetical protein
MTLLLILAAIVLLAVLSPVCGVDSRNLGADEASRDKLWARRC